jgi:predicted HicB family RNase H-like nuclease
MGMLDNDVMKHKKNINKSSEEILAARSKTSTVTTTKGKSGRPAKYNRDENTKRMNLFIPGNLHKQLRQASVDLDASMNEIIIDALLARFNK